MKANYLSLRLSCLNSYVVGVIHPEYMTQIQCQAFFWWEGLIMHLSSKLESGFSDSFLFKHGTGLVGESWNCVFCAAWQFPWRRSSSESLLDKIWIRAQSVDPECVSKRAIDLEFSSIKKPFSPGLFFLQFCDVAEVVIIPLTWFSQISLPTGTYH